ncbi:MAG: acyltransferase [Anaerolineaceae bacterium]|nr:acyltransferase [Anaerolineaceae bacterium]
MDILRAIAILLVMGRHTDSYVTPTALASTPRIISSFLLIYHKGGWVGVDLFFVLSGFLISGLLFKEFRELGKVNIVRFLIRRGFKIYPSFWFLTIMSIIFPLSGFIAQKQQILCDLTFIQSYCFGIWWQSWSLAVEEHFYLLFALTVFILLSKYRSPKPFQIIPRLVLFLAVACLVLRIITAVLSPYSWITSYSPSHLRIDSLGFGVGVGYYYHFKHSEFLKFASSYKIPLIFSGILCLSIAFIFDYAIYPFMYTVGFTILYLGGGMLLIGMTAVHIPNNKFTRMLAYIGIQSYSIYLWHASIDSFFIKLLQYFKILPVLSPMVHLLIYIPAGIGIGILMAKVIEGPFLKLRDRLFPSRVDKPILAAL